MVGELQKFGNAITGYRDGLRGSESVILYECRDVFGLMSYLLELEESKKVNEFTINQLSIEDIYLKLMEE